MLIKRVGSHLSNNNADFRRIKDFGVAVDRYELSESFTMRKEFAAK